VVAQDQGRHARELLLNGLDDDNAAEPQRIINPAAADRPPSRPGPNGETGGHSGIADCRLPIAEMNCRFSLSINPNPQSIGNQHSAISGCERSGARPAS